jgi:hypothetical protein
MSRSRAGSPRGCFPPALGDQFIGQAALGWHLRKAGPEALLDLIGLLQHQAARFLARHQAVALLQAD